MKAIELLETRRENWHTLEGLCVELESRRQRKISAPSVARFAALYRAACADLALADAYQLPPNTVHYLHQLVGRAHNQLYRSRQFRVSAWWRMMFEEAPRQMFRDRTLWLAMAIFWGLFFASFVLGATSPPFVRAMLGDSVKQYEEMYSQGLGNRSSDMDTFMAAFYIQHNTSIGLQCFAYGLFFGVCGLVVTAFNAAFIGAVFGHMVTTPQRDTFITFVTAHGPCELTAIVFCAAAGMRLGFSLIETDGLSRMASLERAGKRALPMISAAIFLFFMAALIEGFLSPSNAPYWIKVTVAVVSAFMIFAYIVVLGSRPGASDAA